MIDEEVKKIAEREYPSDYSMQKYIYDEQLEAKKFMQKASDEEIKKIAEREYPSDYSMQEYIYEEQLEAKKFMQNSKSQNIDAMSDAWNNDSQFDNELDDLTLDNYKQPNPLDYILEQADDAYHGCGEQLQDYAEALKLYKKAANLGSTKALRYIGNMYKEGEGVREDKHKALKYWKEGAKKGDYFCYGEMAFLFIIHEHYDNAIKCFDKYLDGILENPKDWNDGAIDTFGNLVIRIGAIHKASEKKNINLPVNKNTSKSKDELKKAESAFVDIVKRGYNEGQMEKEVVSQLVKDLLPRFKKLLQI